MLYTRQIIFLFIFISQISLANDSIPKNGDHTKRKPILITPIPMSKEECESIKREPLRQSPESTTKDETFDEDDIEEMELMLESASFKAQAIIKHLQDPTYFPQSDDYRSAYFIGKPGSDKTLMAKAIAYKMSQEGWVYKTISSTSIIKNLNDNLTFVLYEDLNTIKKSNKPTIVIIDELDQLLKTSHSKYHDLDIASKFLCEFLDEQKGNKNFFLIGTINDASFLPNSLKEKMFFNIIPFSLVKDAETKSNILRKYLMASNIPLAPEITDSFLNQELEKMGPCSRSNLKKMSAEILLLNKAVQTIEPSLLKKSDINNLYMIHEMTITIVVQEYIMNKNKLSYKRKISPFKK
jgi:AAA+ superfamily predicted ATPase